ncbi:MAG: asparagine synthase (glutamine-hydrolyzing) [Gammaproteobacteria bacterium]|nr:asparagine synthase (glutamine-hydrolyzing) [Gammaproteobacteria bacterium]
MCGLAGIALPGGQEVDAALLRRMNGTLTHRGPDGEGFFVDGNVGLAHRRLSIIDLEAGAQPIFNEDKSVVVVFNGEIYNYQELTEELVAQGHVFRTHSDTETLVHLYEQYGMEMLSRLRGMFAFALFDRRQRALFLVRDRFGIKPCYYSVRDGACYFASEIRPILTAGHPVSPNASAIDLYLRSRFAHSDETIFEGIHRLPEGTYLAYQDGATSLHQYYPTPFHNSRRNDDRSHQELYDDAFASAVESHMVSDVEVGAYLSGGVDSTALVSEMAQLSSHPVKTFCIDFEGHSEAPQAEATARLFGCDHTTIMCSTEDLLRMPEVVATLEEPVGDAIVVAQYILSRATRDAGIKVIMTGDGADETLGGYQYLRAIIQAEKWARRLPRRLLSTAGPALARAMPLGLIDRLAGIPLNVAREARERFALLLSTLDSGTMQDRYDLLLALYRPPELEQLYTPGFLARLGNKQAESLAGEPAGRTIADQVLSLQYRKWLAANINLKQDRLCMAHSVENRVPFLDHKLVELLVTFPEKTKISGKSNKLLLRDLLRRRMDNRIAGAVKNPFHIPLEHYLLDQRLRGLIEDNLSRSRVNKRGVLRYDYVRALKERAIGQGDYLEVKKLFALVILELWFRVFVDGER